MIGIVAKDGDELNKLVARQARLRNSLTGMGSTREEVAKTLRDAGIKGKRRCAGECPVALYLMQDEELPEATVASRAPMAMAGPQGGRVVIRLPTPVEEFVNAFDSGRYEDLDAEA